ncbi:MAG: hypothetical protein Q8P67_01705 [archaeon]|nr:hypothetical protein [archaeon]
MLSTTVVGTNQLELLWYQYAEEGAAPSTSVGMKRPASSIPTAKALLFFRHVCGHLQIEFDEELAQELVRACDPENNGMVSFDSFCTLFVTAKEWAAASPPSAPLAGAGKRDKPTRLQETKISASLIFTADIQKSINQAKRAIKERDTTVFGVPLADAASKNEANPSIPAPLLAAISWLESAKIGSTHAIDEEGLYRVPGSATKFEKYQRLFDSGAAVDFSEFGEKMAENVTLVVIKYLKALPSGGGLLPRGLEERLNEQLAEMESREGPLRYDQAIASLKTLPLPNRITLLYLTDHFLKVASHADKNKMPISTVERTLGICLGFQTSKVVGALMSHPDMLKAFRLASEEASITDSSSSSSSSSTSSSTSSNLQQSQPQSGEPTSSSSSSSSESESGDIIPKMTEGIPTKETHSVSEEPKLESSSSSESVPEPVVTPVEDSLSDTAAKHLVKQSSEFFQDRTCFHDEDDGDDSDNDDDSDSQDN